MRYLFFLVSFSLLIVSCGTAQKKENKSNVADKVQTDTKAEKGTTEGWLGPDIKVNVNDSTTIAKPSKLKASKEKTPEEKKRDLELRRARTSFKNGVEHYNAGQIEDAIIEFKETLMYDPDNAMASYNLGKIYYETKQNDLSITYYEDALRLNPEDSNAMVAIGIIYFERRDFDNAISYFNRAIEKGPRYGLAYYNRGTLLGQQHYYEESLDDLNLAALYSPEDSRVFMNRGMANYFLKDMAAACTDWNRAAEMGNLEATKAVSIYCNKKSR